MSAPDKEAVNLYIQNLEEYILDEGKIVTYKWLSKELNLHVNKAKQLLHVFLKKYEQKVHATYLLSGVLQDGLTHKVLIVQEDGLVKVKSQFKTIASEHVYSVQRAKDIGDLNALYIIDRYNKDENEVKRLNTIHCDEAVQRATDEIARLKIKAQLTSGDTDAKAWPASKKKAATEINKVGESATAAADEKVDHKKEETVKKKEIKNGGIAAMFAAQSSKNQKLETTEKSKAEEKTASKMKSGIAAFFNRQTEKPKVKNTSLVHKDSKFCSESNSEPLTEYRNEYKEPTVSTNQINGETKNTEKGDSNKSKSKRETAQKEKKSNNSKISTGREKNKRNASYDPPPSKKRKRIVCVSDSEDSSDSDIFGKDDDDEETVNLPISVPEPTPAPPVESDEELIAPTQQTGSKPGRKRERRLKVNTFMDEDGYIVTKKEYVVESCTDSEGEKSEENMKFKESSEKVKEDKSPTSEPPAKKKCSPQKVKQATLMNFFKKN